jgi:hypothetical protein
MRRKRLLLLTWAGLSLLLVEGALIVALLLRPPQGPAARIRPSMALADVEAILGPAAETPAPASGANRVRVWMTRDGPIPVEFDEDDRVSSRGVVKGQRPTWLDGLRGRLGW